jgi:hypothetical protein
MLIVGLVDSIALEKILLMLILSTIGEEFKAGKVSIWKSKLISLIIDWYIPIPALGEKPLIKEFLFLRTQTDLHSWLNSAKPLTLSLIDIPA